MFAVGLVQEFEDFPHIFTLGITFASAGLLPGHLRHLLKNSEGEACARNRCYVQADLANAWADHGVEAIEQVAKSDPGTFCKIVSNVLPKEVGQMAAESGS
jgi:hypothetical protein